MNKFTDNLKELEAPKIARDDVGRNLIAELKYDNAVLAAMLSMLQDRFEWRDILDEMPEMIDLIDVAVYNPNQRGHFYSGVKLISFDVYDGGSPMRKARFQTLGDRTEADIIAYKAGIMYWKPHVKPGEEFVLTEDQQNELDKLEKKLKGHS